MKKSLLFTILLGLVLMLAACGEDDKDTTSEAADSSNTETTEETDESSASSETAPSNEITVVGHNFGFDQEEYVVQSGEEVTLKYVNDEGNHGISIEGLDVVIQGEGEANFIPEEPGEYEIICNIFCGTGHEDMVAKLIVL